MWPAQDNTDKDEFDALANFDDFYHVADEKFSPLEDDFKKKYSFGILGDVNEEIINEEFLDKVAHHDVYELLSDFPENANKEGEDDNISLGSYLEKPHFLEDDDVNVDSFCPQDVCGFSAALKFQADFSNDNEFLTDLNAPLAVNNLVEQTLGGIIECDVSAALEKIKRKKSSSIRPKAREQKKPNPELSSMKHKKQREEIMAAHFLDTGEYRDFSQVSHEFIFEGLKFGSMRGRPQEPFPFKLHKIVEQSEADGYSSLISWLPHGRAFKIHNTSQFVERVMKKYFYQTKLSSFQRQLKVYGFYRLQHNLDEGAYCHELFLRGRPGLCAGIMRKKSRRTVDLKKEPNFYAMPPVDPINGNSCKAEHADFLIEPRTVCYLNKQDKTEAKEDVKATVQPQSKHLASERLKSRRTVDLKKKPNFCAMPPVDPINGNSGKAEHADFLIEPRTVYYLNKQDKTEAKEEVKATLQPQSKHLASERLKSRRTVDLKKKPNFCAMPPVDPIKGNSCKAEHADFLIEPRTVCCLNKQDKTEAKEDVKVTVQPQSKHLPSEIVPDKENNTTSTPESEPVLSAPALQILPPPPMPLSDAAPPVSMPIKTVNSKPTPIRIIRNGKALTKRDVKSGGFRLVTNISNKHSKTVIPSVSPQVSLMVAQGFPLK